MPAPCSIAWPHVRRMPTTSDADNEHPCGPHRKTSQTQGRENWAGGVTSMLCRVATRAAPSRAWKAGSSQRSPSARVRLCRSCEMTTVLLSGSRPAKPGVKRTQILDVVWTNAGLS